MSMNETDQELIETVTKVLLGEEEGVKRVSDYPHAHHYIHGMNHYTDGQSHSKIGNRIVPKKHQKSFEHIEKKMSGKSKSEIYGHGQHYAYHGDDRPENKHPDSVHSTLDKH